MADQDSTTNAATRLFAVPELLELILLHLPRNTSHEELTTTRFILQNQTVHRTWAHLIHSSSVLRQALYLPNAISTEASPVIWSAASAFPPAQPNPWIPFLLLGQRGWGSAYPFDLSNFNLSSDIENSKPRLWTFTLEFSRVQFASFPRPGPWREMLVSEPPFQELWYTRSFYELGSGRAPFVTHLDYDPKLPRAKQRYRKGKREGATLGMVVDAVAELFELDGDAKFVMIESLACDGDDEEIDLSKDRPMTRSYMPGSSAEKAHGWVRGH